MSQVEIRASACLQQDAGDQETAENEEETDTQMSKVGARHCKMRIKDQENGEGPDTIELSIVQVESPHSVRE
ncbi:hypothetical protein MesoLjLb_24390 [Mesorhizobium sp. L-8-3]|nr:hypothetical protein MesoLjLb_24390 [Mesorhizobium sp. L-8-3]